MFELKSLNWEAIPAALEKAHRYRLLNEPEQAESICEDILRIDPDNQQAITTLLLAHTDRFATARPVSPQLARELLTRLHEKYDQQYFAGLIAEREGIAWLHSNKPHCGEAAYHCFREAMSHYEQAEEIRPPANDDALLRWNSCARIIMSHPDVAPEQEVATAQFGD
jgi:tetratricopeptide (TPR) repeat protein